MLENASRFAPVLLLALGLTACATPERFGPPGDGEPDCARESAGKTVIVFRPNEVPGLAPGAPAAREVATAFEGVREAVAKVLGREPPVLDARVYLDSSWRNTRYLVTHARVSEKPPPLRVVVPCPVRPSETTADFVDRVRSTIVHEVAEATVVLHLTRATVLDPYLRWLHDGIAVYCEYVIEAERDPAAAAARLEGYRKEIEDAKKRRQSVVRWLDLTRWRQFTPWIINSEVLMTDQSPLRLDDLGRSLRQLANDRSAFARDESLLTRAALGDLIADAWRKEYMPFGNGEANPDELTNPNNADRDAMLFYYASCAVFIEIERERPGALLETLEAIGAGRRAPVLTNAIAMRMLSKAAGTDVEPRILRYTIERLERVLNAELERLKPKKS